MNYAASPKDDDDDDDDADVWSFGFGSNMNVDFVVNKKKIPVLESVAGIVSGWRVAMAQKAMPLVEPAFATALPGEPMDEIHGVALRLSAAAAAELRKPHR